MNYLKVFLERYIPKNNGLYGLVRNVYHYRPWKPRQVDNLDIILDSFNSYRSNEVFFVQIGSNDGLHGDPIYKYVKESKWHGILVEPIPEVFENLKYNYRENDKHLIFENIAITANNTGSGEFYFVRNDDNALPGWVSQLSSFDKNVILKHCEYHPEIKDRIVVKKILHDTFENMLKRNNVQTIDLIHIDTEGYDFEILKNIDFEKYKPAMIIYEHKHLSEGDYKSSIGLLKQNRYKLFAHKGDTIALQASLASRIRGL